MRKGKRGRGRPWQHPHSDSSHVPFASIGHSETGPGGVEYHVQYLPGALKEYVCPGCLHTVAIGASNVVAWPEETRFGMPSGSDARRHWHTDCWRRGLRPD